MCLFLWQHHVLITVALQSEVREGDFTSSFFPQDCLIFRVFYAAIQILELFVLVL